MAALGTTPSCSWPSADTLILEMGLGSTLDTGSQLEVSSSTIRSYNSDFSTGQVTVDAADNPQRPTADIVSPTRVGTCQSVLLDATQSFGARAVQLDLQWSLSESTQLLLLSRSFDFTGLTAYLEDASSRNLMVIELQRSELPGRGEIFVGLTVTNQRGDAAGLSDYTQAGVQLVDRALPSVEIVGAAFLTTDPAAPAELLFDGVASIPEACGAELQVPYSCNPHEESSLQL